MRTLIADHIILLASNLHFLYFKMIFLIFFNAINTLDFPKKTQKVFRVENRGGVWCPSLMFAELSRAGGLF